MFWKYLVIKEQTALFVLSNSCEYEYTTLIFQVKIYGMKNVKC